MLNTRSYFLIFIFSLVIVALTAFLFASQHAFAQQKILLSVSKNIFEAGKISTADNIINCDLSCSTAGVSYKNGDSVTITAVPYAGYTFVGWSGDCFGANPICVLTMNSAKTVKANFNVASATVQPKPPISVPMPVIPAPPVVAPPAPAPIGAVQSNPNANASTTSRSLNPIIIGIIAITLFAILIFVIAWFWKSRARY